MAIVAVHSRVVLTLGNPALIIAENLNRGRVHIQVQGPGACIFTYDGSEPSVTNGFFQLPTYDIQEPDMEVSGINPEKFQGEVRGLYFAALRPPRDFLRFGLGPVDIYPRVDLDECPVAVLELEPTGGMP